MHVSGRTATIRSSVTVIVTANMHLIGKRYFLYRYRIVIVCSVTGQLQVIFRKTEKRGIFTRGCISDTSMQYMTASNYIFSS